MAYTSEGFPGGLVRASGELQTNWDELLWAALTVGRPNTAYVFRHNYASYHEALFRLSLVRMALGQRTSGGPLYRTEAFKSLDPTEKGAVSYFLGMAVCKLFASRLLATPWLLHVDVFRDQLDPTVLGGRSRPDLVGQDGRGRWHAFECKGRSSVPNAEDKRKAKEQAQRLLRVNSTNCSLHVGAISYFRQEALVFHWRDPEPEAPEALDPIRINVTGEMWRFHYEPAVPLVVHAERRFLWEARKALDIDVQIHREVLPLLLEGSWAAAHLRARELRNVFAAEGFQADGLRVVAGDSWRTEGQLG
ncbi:MAG: hypothetical protein F4Z12_03745 [Acidobacteria bacterium]|nr:hypothetical protein [Acidobacteriota bacterium]MYI96621.1 hypothetical protein [Acidobacteriota bacterium]